MIFPLTAYRRLYAALQEHRKVEEEIHRLLTDLLEPDYIRPEPVIRCPPLAYAQRHFFSILFLSLYQAIGIPPERRLLYGMINHCLRGIVTGTDNLLDEEYKELLPLNFPESATRFKSVMHILLFDRMLSRINGRLQASGLSDTNDLSLDSALFKAIVPIGAEEAQEEGGIEEIISPEAVLETVHMYKGGKLLCLSFVAPRLLESNEFQERLTRADRGIFHIGMALQIIDDLTDFHEDIKAGNHNYLLSFVFHQGNPQEKELLKTILKTPGSKPEIEVSFASAISQVMNSAVSEALRGFALIHQAGYWLDHNQAYHLIRRLFVLRGVKRLLPFYPPEASVAPRAL